MLNPAEARAARRRRARRWLNLLLLPLALLVVVLEDVLWAGALAVLRRLAGLAALQRLRAVLAALPGWLALPLILVPEALGKLGEFWALALLAHGRVVGGVLAYVAVRAVATLIVVFIYHACEPALLRVRWFAAVVRAMHWVRDWALAKLRPARDRVRAFIRRRRSVLRDRFAAAQIWLRRRLPVR